MTHGQIDQTKKVYLSHCANCQNREHYAYSDSLSLIPCCGCSVDENSYQIRDAAVQLLCELTEIY